MELNNVFGTDNMSITDSSYNYTSDQIRKILKDSVEINVTEKTNPDLFYWLCVLNQIFIWAESKKQVLQQWLYIMGETSNPQHSEFNKKYSNITGNMRYYTSWSLSYSNKVNHIREYRLVYEHYQNDGKKDKPMISLENQYTKKTYYPFWTHVSGFGRENYGYRCSNIIEFLIMLCYVEYDWEYNYTKECLERAINLIESGTKLIKDEYINNFSVDEWCCRAYDNIIFVNKSNPQVSYNLNTWYGYCNHFGSSSFSHLILEVTSKLKHEKNYKDKDRTHHYFDIEIKTKDDENNEPFKLHPVDRTKIKFIVMDNSINVCVM